MWTSQRAPDPIFSIGQSGADDPHKASATDQGRWWLIVNMERGESHVPAFLRPVFVRLPDLRFGSRAVILAARKSRRLCLRKETSATPARFVAMARRRHAHDEGCALGNFQLPFRFSRRGQERAVASNVNLDDLVVGPFDGGLGRHALDRLGVQVGDDVFRHYLGGLAVGRPRVPG